MNWSVFEAILGIGQMSNIGISWMLSNAIVSLDKSDKKTAIYLQMLYHIGQGD